MTAALHCALNFEMQQNQRREWCACPQRQRQPTQETGGEHGAVLKALSACRTVSFEIYIHTLHKGFGVIKKSLLSALVFYPEHIKDFSLKIKMPLETI